MSHFLQVAFRVQFSHVRVFSDSRNLQKRATKSDTSDHCLLGILVLRGRSVRTYGGGICYLSLDEF